ncbi:MAG TPA: sulfurtransferase TusA family protein [Nitrososphaerales archaeon]|nr:sulfurtransferase TusA family protein [Nitrososphaerales archaeon]
MAIETLRLITGSGDLANLPASLKLDTRGLVCPYPAFESSKIALSAGESDVIEIISDDEYVATSTVPAVLSARSLEYAVVKYEDGTFSIKARRKRR